LTLAQVPLTDDGQCEGGHLLFACSDGQLMHVQRRVGSIMAHDGDAVHGVTQLIKGIRYWLKFWLLGGRTANTQPIAQTRSQLHRDAANALSHPSFI
jgi:predicted 2-oxoglutarate/Fe(II)-dependent dioxygenase YbiX